ncbi:COG4 transport protein-domain-containing protein, partial [Dimargaris cristalligena]
MLDLNAIRTFEEVQSALQLLEFDETAVIDELDDLLIQVEEQHPQWLAQLSNQVRDLDRLETSHLQLVRHELPTSARLAAGIQNRVEMLDQEKVHITRAREQVERTLELDQAITDLRRALQHHNALDQAAALVHRYLTVTPDLLESDLTGFIWPGSHLTSPPETDGSPATNADSKSRLGWCWWDGDDDENTDKTKSGSGDGGSNTRDPPATVRELFERVRRQLVRRVTAQFDQAVADHQTRTISQCFKLFPLLKQENLGLDRYSQFLCDTMGQQLIRPGSPNATNPPAPSTARAVQRLTVLFETVARIIDNHFPVVETHYGPGKMIRVIQFLQRDTDRRVAQILDSFKEDHALDRKLADIKEYDRQAPHEQSATGMMGLPVSGGVAGAGATNPLASSINSLGKRLAQQNWLDDSTSLTAGVNDPTPIPPADIKQLNGVLDQLAVIIQRLGLYQRFLESRAEPETQTLKETSSIHQVFLNDDPRLTFTDAGLIKNSPVPTWVDTLSSAFISMETFVLRYSIHMALSTVELNSNDQITSG